VLRVVRGALGRYTLFLRHEYGLVFPAYKMVGAPRPRSAPPGISHASAS
jgi:hypothetical protein